MIRRCRRLLRCPRPLHLFTLALLLMVMAVQPVLAAVGEIHDLPAHGGSNTSEQLDRHSEVDPDIQDPPASSDIKYGDDSQSPLHVLLHYTHCCTTAPVSLPAALVTPQSPLTDVLQPQRTTALALSARASELHRPPILD